MPAMQAPPIPYGSSTITALELKLVGPLRILGMYPYYPFLVSFSMEKLCLTCIRKKVVGEKLLEQVMAWTKM